MVGHRPAGDLIVWVQKTFEIIEHWSNLCPVLRANGHEISATSFDEMDADDESKSSAPNRADEESLAIRMMSLRAIS